LVGKKVKRKFWLIHNLSAPLGHSINDAIPDSFKSVDYCKVSDVVDYLALSQEHDFIWLSLLLRTHFGLSPSVGWAGSF